MIKIKHKDQIREVPEHEIIEIEDLDLGFQVIPKNVKVILRGNSILKASRVSRVEAYDNSFIDLEEGQVILRGQAVGIIRHKAICFQYDYSRAHYFWKSEGTLTDYSLGLFNMLSSGVLTYHARGIFFGRSRGTLREYAEGRFYDSSFGLLMEDSEGWFYNWSSGELSSSEAQAYSYGESKIIKKVPYTVKNLKKWIGWNNAEYIRTEDQIYVYLYKWVDTNYKDFYSGTIDYSKDEIEAPDWDPNHKGECGKGLHLAFDPWIAFHFDPFREGRMLKFKVPAQYIKIYTGKDCYGPYKVRVQKLNKFIAELKLEKNKWVEVKNEN